MADTDIAGDVLKRLQNKQNDAELNESPLKETVLLPFKMTAKEVRAICQKYPDHPLSKEKRRSVADMPDNMEVVLDTPDVEAMLTNKEIEVVREQVTRSVMGSEQKVWLDRKKLVERKQESKEPAPSPEPSRSTEEPAPRGRKQI